MKVSVGESMRFFSLAKEISKALIYREAETPRILRYIYDLIDEDLDDGKLNPQ